MTYDLNESKTRDLRSESAKNSRLVNELTRDITRLVTRVLRLEDEVGLLRAKVAMLEAAKPLGHRA